MSNLHNLRPGQIRRLRPEPALFIPLARAKGDRINELKAGYAEIYEARCRHKWVARLLGDKHPRPFAIDQKRQSIEQGAKQLAHQAKGERIPARTSYPAASTAGPELQSTLLSRF